MAFSLCAMLAAAQTRNHKLGIILGGGSQKYKGDLGNGFTLRNDTWFGGFTMHITRYGNASFDGGVYGYIGDFGFCQSAEDAKKAIDEVLRCKGCVGRAGLGNLSSRMMAMGAFLKYKFANGRLLSEVAKLRPYVTAGVATINLSDRMKMNCINEGTYFSVNAGAGVKYYLTNQFSVGYNLQVGYFFSDDLDYLQHHCGDLHLQNTLFLGIDLF